MVFVDGLLITFDVQIVQIDPKLANEPWKILDMAEILLTHKPVPSSRLSANRLHWQYSGYRLFSSYLILMFVTGLITIVAVGLLLINDNEHSMRFEQYAGQI